MSKNRGATLKSGRRKSATSERKTSGAARPRQAKRRATLVEPLGAAGAQWTFLTNHTHVLLLLARDASVVLRDVAFQIGITERAVQRIIADLEFAGVIEREKVGRQNHYRIRMKFPLRHPITAHTSIGQVLDLINGGLQP
jgi:hypothetical protein